MTKISELGTTAYPSLEHEFPASKDGETVKLTVQQVRDLMEFSASEIATEGDSNVQSKITALSEDKADVSYVDEQDNAIADGVTSLSSAVVKHSAAQSLTDTRAHKG